MGKFVRLTAVASLALGAVVLGTGAARAAPADGHASTTCTGTFSAPGVLAGTYRGDVVVTGVCFVNGGAAVIKGDLILEPGSVLNATFALNDVAGTGTSSLAVRGDVQVRKGALLAMGCEAVHSPCSDDPNASTGGTLTGQDTVSGDVIAVHALGVLLHASTIRRSVSLLGGGGAESCDPPFPGAFAVIGSPPFSDAEDNTIGGNLTMIGIRSCWLGALRNSVRGNVLVVGNTMADPDAMEITSNHIRGSMACFRNSPAVQYGDATMGSPNQVGRHALGQCSFTTLQPNPAPSGPLTPVSVKA